MSAPSWLRRSACYPHDPAVFSMLQGVTMMNLLEALEDLDDVQNVYSNGEFPDSVLEG